MHMKFQVNILSSSEIMEGDQPTIRPTGHPSIRPTARPSVRPAGRLARTLPENLLKQTGLNRSMRRRPMVCRNHGFLDGRELLQKVETSK